MTRFFLSIAAILAVLSVAAGAFAAHGLKDSLSERALEIFDTAARYQMYHALALMFVALLLSGSEAAQSILTVAGLAFITGTVLFSGSLYGLSVTGMKGLGAITPLGGVAFIIGWVCIAIAAWNFD